MGWGANLFIGLLMKYSSTTVKSVNTGPVYNGIYGTVYIIVLNEQFRGSEENNSTVGNVIVNNENQSNEKFSLVLCNSILAGFSGERN